MTNNRDKWIAGIRDEPKRDRDAVIIITGKEGVGKSTFAQWLAPQLDESFTVDRICWSGADFMAKAITLPAGSVIILDEAVEGGYSREAMAAKNKDLTKFLMVSRQRNLIALILFPNIRWLDSYISEHRASRWVLIEARGRALIHQLRRADYKGANAGWNQLFRTAYPKVTGATWDEYKERKAAMVTRQAQGDTPQPFQPDAARVRRKAAHFRLLLERDSTHSR